MRAFVTGAASPLGRALVDILTQRGDKVVGQIRRRNGVNVLRKLGAECLICDLSKTAPLTEAMQSCDVVFHVAQFFDFWSASQSTFHAVNVQGAEAALSAAIAANVRRVVFCSSSMTIGERPGYTGTETTKHRGYTVTAFERSKLSAEHAALRYRSKGLDVIVVNPALIVAANDPGWTGRLIADQIAGRQRCASHAPMGWVAVQDAARGLVRAAEVGRSGERYILSAETFSLHDFLGSISKYSHQDPPRALTSPVILGRAAISTAFGRLRSMRPSLPADEARFATTGFRVDGMHASIALGIDYTPINRYLPNVVKSYRTAMLHFAD